MRLLGALALAVALVACSSGADDSDVPWHQYAPEVRDRVEQAIDAEDCDAMSDEFWSASDGTDAHRAKWGEGNGELMSYIDDAMEDAGCP